jgi:hypothetical protein
LLRFFKVASKGVRLQLIAIKLPGVMKDQEAVLLKALIQDRQLVSVPKMDLALLLMPRVQRRAVTNVHTRIRQDATCSIPTKSARVIIPIPLRISRVRSGIAIANVCFLRGTGKKLKGYFAQSPRNERSNSPSGVARGQLSR